MTIPSTRRATLPPVVVENADERTCVGLLLAVMRGQEWEVAELLTHTGEVKRQMVARHARTLATLAADLQLRTPIGGQK